MKFLAVTDNLVYFIKSNGDPIATILKVKSWADEVGGMRKLKELVDTLPE